MGGWMDGWCVDVWMDEWVGKWMDGIRRRARRPDKNEEVVDVMLSRRTWKCPENVSWLLELKLLAMVSEEGVQLSNQNRPRSTHHTLKTACTMTFRT